MERRVRIIGRFYRRRDYGRRIKRYNRDFGELSEKFYYNLDNKKIKENIVTKVENMKTFKEVRDDLRNIRFFMLITINFKGFLSISGKIR